MGKINNYTVDPVNPGDKILASDANTGDTKNVSAQSISDLQTSQTIYRAYLTQSGSNPPVATELPGNTLTGTWEYDGTGVYLFTTDGLFNGVNVGVICSILTSYNYSVVNDGYNNDSLYILTYNVSTLTDNILNNTYIEIFTHDNL
jgi:hypothetical protein